MLEWNSSDWILVLAGSGGGDFIGRLRTLVTRLGLGERVLILPRVPRDLWYDCLLSADVGIALYEPGNINHDSMAGAGNKLNLYLSAHIPSVIPASPDFERFSRSCGASEVADPSDSYSIARAINTLLSDSERYASYCRQAAHAFHTEYNFEQQFAPVLAHIQRVHRLDTALPYG